MDTSRRFAKLLPALALVALAIPASASAQATRTWVSGVGDDANPCSRTAPCKTFAGAISKTAAKGEINVIDPGGFGAVTITKSITIKAEGPTAGVLTNAANAININAAATDKVKLIGLDINGLGTASNGIRITSAKYVVIKNNDIYEFARNAISVETSSATTKVLVANNEIHDNVGVGVMSAPTSAGTNDRVTVQNNDIEDNGCGIVSTLFGVDPAFNYSLNCGTATSASGVSGRSVVNAFGNQIADNVGAGIFARGNTSALQQGIARYGHNDISGNAFGVQIVDGGQLISFGNNNIDGNANNSPPTTVVAPTKRLP
jgi:hypothetical protein